MINEEKHLLPMATMELGLTKFNARSYTEAEYWLKKAKNNYSGYLFELMILMKIHTTLQRIKHVDTNNYNNKEHDVCI